MRVRTPCEAAPGRRRRNRPALAETVAPPPISGRREGGPPRGKGRGAPVPHPTGRCESRQGRRGGGTAAGQNGKAPRWFSPRAIRPSGAHSLRRTTPGRGSKRPETDAKPFANCRVHPPARRIPGKGGGTESALHALGQVLSLRAPRNRNVTASQKSTDSSGDPRRNCNCGLRNRNWNSRISFLSSAKFSQFHLHNRNRGSARQ